ncbi:hypothetical protein H072_9666 [Dactylellina haptotyla CBS 200.50]|uniref:Uncharacterized protein n=1 Tax=Dactylellina haptotyla (strain CBS 200.50) TaxID=1284197 RepID=S8A1E6_DACHA|nr:hypothetical protein H072_9666 [Dactylellina haptotyla CBS 200.50]
MNRAPTPAAKPPAKDEKKTPQKPTRMPPPPVLNRVKDRMTNFEGKGQTPVRHSPKKSPGKSILKPKIIPLPKQGPPSPYLESPLAFNAPDYKWPPASEDIHRKEERREPESPPRNPRNPKPRSTSEDDSLFERHTIRPIARSLSSSTLRGQIPQNLRSKRPSEGFDDIVFRDENLVNIWNKLESVGGKPDGYTFDELMRDGLIKDGVYNYSGVMDDEDEESEGAWQFSTADWKFWLYLTFAILGLIVGRAVYPYFFVGKQNRWMPRGSISSSPIIGIGWSRAGSSKYSMGWSNLISGLWIALVNALTAMGLGFLVGRTRKNIWEKIKAGEFEFTARDFKELISFIAELGLRVLGRRKRRLWWQFWKN